MLKFFALNTELARSSRTAEGQHHGARIVFAARIADREEAIWALLYRLDGHTGMDIQVSPLHDLGPKGQGILFGECRLAESAM